MNIKHIVLGFFAAAAVLVGCEPKEEDFGVAKIEVSTGQLTFGPASGSQTLQVTASRDWTVTGLPEWIAVDPAGGAPSKSAQTVTVTVIANDGYNREADVTFSIGLMKEYVKVLQTGQKGEYDTGNGTKERPYSASAAADYVSSLPADTESSDAIYIKGIISSVGTTYEASGNYGNASFYISDDGSSTGTQFYVFQTYYLGGKKWKAGDDDVKVGDEVIIYGKVVNYKGNTPETVGKGASYVYSHNGKTAGETPTPPAGDPKGTGTKDDPFNPAGAAAYAQSLGSDVQSPNSVYIKGKISEVSTTFEASGSYGNANFYIVDSEDGTGSFYIFQTYYLGNRKWAVGDKDVKVGDEVVVYGPVINYKGNTPETAGKGASYIYSLNGETGGGPATEVDHGATTIASFLAASESSTDWYELTGTISGLKNDDQYGNFKLTDASGTVYVYGVLSEKGGEKKKFQELVSKYGIANGGTITIKANRGSYTNSDGSVKDEAVNAYFISYSGGDTPPAGETDHGATTVASFLAASESTSDWYELTGTISGLKDDDQYGNFDLTDASGTVYVYGVLSEKGGEKKKFQELVSQYGIDNGGTITIKANRGSFNGKDEAVNAYFVSYKAGGDVPPSGDEVDHGATKVASFLAASESTSDWYELTGVISGLKDGDQYGNFDLTDDSGSVYVYGVLSTKGGEKKKFQELVEKYGIANGGTITIKANRGSFNGKDEAVNAYFVSYKAGGDVPPSGDEVDHGATKVASFLAASESTSDWYELTGVISGLKDGDQYGNFDLTDDSGSVYVYGVLSTKGGEKKKFQELVEKYGIANGGTITIKANRGSYNDKDEAVNAYFVSYKPGEGGGEQTEDGYKISWSGQSDWNGVSDGAETISLKAGNYTITVSKEKGSTKPTVNGSSNDCRAYALNTVKVANSSADITSLTFVISNQGKKRLTDITASAGEVKIDKDNWMVTWTGSAKEVTFTVGEKATYGTDGDSKAGQFDFDYILAKPE